jgi:hypothetical protein
MEGNVRWMAAGITMDGGSEITMEGDSGNRQQWRCNGQWDGKAVAMGKGTEVAQWTAQWAADICCQCRRGARGGDARWTAVVIIMDGGGKIVMDGGSGNGQWQRNGQKDGKAITMGDGTEVAQWMAQWVADDGRRCRRGTMGGDTDGRQWQS